MIGPMHNARVYPIPVDTSNEEPVPVRKKRSVDTTSSLISANTNDRTRRRTGGMDSLGRGNIL